MELKDILSHVDHTLLKQTATWEDIRVLIDDAITYGTASVCIPPQYIRQGAEYAAGKMKMCTVIGFPNGYHTTPVKAFETKQACLDGADEIDMVIHVGMVKMGKYDAVLEDIKAVRAACPGKILKVIIETCLLTDEEKIKMCQVVGESGADYIKTSTGFAGGGATLHDIELFAAHVPAGLKIKAAGGISSVSDAEAFLAAGADRLGTSRLVAEAKGVEAKEKY
ncbi:MAG: deoxyribose-phosphate aldolase [Clostridia bacterium]|nr:deoxyribose-phosphate aldolase [Clostridia bacterium]